MRVIKDNEVVEDEWQRVEVEGENAELPDGDIIVPYTYWKNNRDQLLDRKQDFGVCVKGDDIIEEVADDIEHFKLIALDFPEFKDGRSYSHARILRDRYGYQGELRAVGDILRDQLFFLRRCGFNSYQVREDKNIEDAVKGFADFSVTYQTAADGALPVYKNR